jgi:hypothetical protein
MKINKKHIEFLKEYQSLCKKYNMGLWGCGCCDSPALTDYNNGKWDYVEDLDNINFHKNGELTIEPQGKNELNLSDFIKKWDER